MAANKNSSGKSKKDSTKNKEKIYEIYKIWKSLPPQILGTADSVMEEHYGIHDDLQKKLINITTQKEFAEEFNISRTTTTKWNKELREDQDDMNSFTKNFARDLTKSLVFSLYENAKESGDPNRIRLWLQFVENWSATQGLEISTDQKLLEAIEGKTQSIADSLASGDAETEKTKEALESD